ncbi:VanZ family protein [Echinimonas agarilytica]|uniref:VanZ family protein n=1 Tax=Echinimonas agarilytica TaxID=1215918 RepID=A0AA41W823_9GAMM|nr:VanZ family protein [Echinimonas agarilytica]
MHYLLNQPILFRFFFVSALITVTWTCLMPLDEPVVNINNFDKVMHLGAYFVLAGLFERSFPNHFIKVGIIALIAYSGLIELLQGQTGYRSASLADLIANSLGVFCYLALMPIVRKLAKPPATKAASCTG